MAWSVQPIGNLPLGQHIEQAWKANLTSTLLPPGHKQIQTIPFFPLAIKDDLY